MARWRDDPNIIDLLGSLRMVEPLSVASLGYPLPSHKIDFAIEEQLLRDGNLRLPPCEGGYRGAKY